MTDPNSREWWDEYFHEKWDRYGGAERTRYLMETILVNLPQQVKEVLESSSITILDWGCAFGDGVAALGEAYPRGHVTGLDFSQTAIEQARIRNSGKEYIWSKDGAIDRDYDVIVTSNCLEAFEQPLERVEEHLASCRMLYIVLVRYNEAPLHLLHKAQFRSESFPLYVRNFMRVHAGTISSDPRFWPGQQLLVVYASERCLGQGQGEGDPVMLALSGIEALRNADRERADKAESALSYEREQREILLQSEREKWEDLLRLERAKWEALLQNERDHEAAVRAQMISGIQEFEDRFNKQLAAYRSARAWRVMLAIRKAYTLMVRSKAGGISRLLRWGGDAIFRRDAKLEEFELTFPAPTDFLPSDSAGRR